MQQKKVKIANLKKIKLSKKLHLCSILKLFLGSSDFPPHVHFFSSSFSPFFGLETLYLPKKSVCSQKLTIFITHTENINNNGFKRNIMKTKVYKYHK